MEMNIDGFDGTLDFYDDVTKQLNVSLIVPPTYDKKGAVIITNPSPADATLCFAEVAEVRLKFYFIIIIIQV